jgi:hypothetical protein
VNKKILGLILLAVLIIMPAVALGIDDPETIATTVSDLAVTFGVAIVVIGWVVAGILYLMAAGDPGKIKTAKTAMIAAIIGTVLVVIAKAGYPAIKSLIDSIIGTSA